MRLNPRYAQEFGGGSAPFDYYGKNQTLGEVPGSIIYNYVCQSNPDAVSALVRLINDQDVIIYRALNPLAGHKITIKDLASKLKKTVQLIPLTGPFNDGYFFRYENCQAGTLQHLRNHLERNGVSNTLRLYTIHGDLDWKFRFQKALDITKAREISENVSLELRMSDVIERDYQRRRLFLMRHHPSSHLFWPWALRLAEYLGIPFVGKDAAPDREFPLNWADLPGLEAVCESARKHLGLTFPKVPWDTTEIRGCADQLREFQLSVASGVPGAT